MATVYAERTMYSYDGIYLPSEVASYLLVGLRLAKKRPPNSRRILSWIRSGLLAEDKRTTRGHDLTMNFDDLVSCQAITLLHEAGFSIQEIRKAEGYLSRVHETPKPFARHEVWHALPHIFTQFDGQFLSATKPDQYALAFVEKWVVPLKARLSFVKSSGNATCWKPRNRITLRPDTQFGQPCVEGTRIPTSALWGYIKGGDSIPYIARSFGLEAIDVKVAFEWEERRRSRLLPKTKVSD